MFDHPTVNEFEAEVANTLGLDVYSSDKEIIGELVRKEIELSNITSEILLTHFINNKEVLKKFTTLAYLSESTTVALKQAG